MALKLNGTNSVAAPAYAGADADTGLQCGTDELKLVTGGTARATVDSSGDVMIGTTSNNAHADADNLIVGSTGGTHQGMTINGSTSSQIRFADSGSNTAGYIIYSHSANNLQFATNGSERMRILSSGGITFNGDTASTNALDDYEEGTFDAFSSVAERYTGESTRCSRYTRIGNLVRCDLRVQWTGTINTNAALAFDLPFAEAGTTGGGTAATGNTGIVFYQGTSVDSSAISTHIPRNGSLVTFYRTDGGSSFSSVNYNNVNSTYDWLVSFSYFCA